MFNKNQARYFVSIIIILIILLIYKGWFLFNPLSAGDWSFFYNSSLKEFSINPSGWNSVFNSGLGGSNMIILGLFFYFSSTIYFLFNFFHIPWVLIERIVWFWPLLFISVFSSYYLFKKLFSNKFALLSSFIFLFNTYILMIVGGGQMGIAMAYALAPLVLNSFIKAVDVGFKNYDLRKNVKLPIIAGLLFSLQIVFDLRIAYITLAAVAVYAVLSIINHVFSKETLREKIFYILNFIFYIFIVPGIVVFLLNAFWVLPTILSRRNPIEELGLAYSSLEAVKFFSFAKFENTLSLLHPNWPENIFGKVGFLKPEFLILPILAYSSLLFIANSKLKNNSAIEQSNNRTIIFFALLGLLGAFLAKGANEPFGGVYLWLFDNFPGFIMFRDPTKWYTLVAISYSILIPFSVWKIYEWIKSHSEFLIFNFKFSIKSKNQILNFQNLFLLIIAFCLLFLIRPALFGQLSGTFKTTPIPEDYIKLEKFIAKDSNFSRTLWVPTLQRFGFYSNLHPAIPAQNLFKTVENTEIIKKMNTKEAELLLQEASVKYVIVPFDSQGEIFLKDRKYDNKLYQQAVRGVSEIPWLKRVDCSIVTLLNCSGNPFGKIAVFEVPNPKDHFYINNQQSAITNQELTYQYLSPVEYRLEVKNAKIGEEIIFSESYDAGWQARDSNAKFYDWPNLISSNPYNRIFNSFTLRKEGDYSLMIYYYPQILVNIGMIISGLSLALILGALIYLRKKKI